MPQKHSQHVFFIIMNLPHYVWLLLSSILSPRMFFIFVQVYGTEGMRYPKLMIKNLLTFAKRCTSSTQLLRSRCVPVISIARMYQYHNSFYGYFDKQHTFVECKELPAFFIMQNLYRKFGACEQDLLDKYPGKHDSQFIRCIKCQGLMARSEQECGGVCMHCAHTEMRVFRNKMGVLSYSLNNV